MLAWRWRPWRKRQDSLPVSMMWARWVSRALLVGRCDTPKTVEGRPVLSNPDAVCAERSDRAFWGRPRRW